MRAKEGTFRDLMTQDRQFQIPLYQRHYRWKTDQQEDLWLDIVEQYQALAEGTSVSKHFIGSIVAVEQDADPLHDFREFRVVDGQQRLTTLSVALAALRDVASLDDPTQYDRLNKKYLINDTEPKGSTKWARLVPGDEDEAPYWTVLTDSKNATGHSSIVSAYRFFYRKISALRNAGILVAERLATTIGDRLALVFVTVDEGERPHKIFESINATGVGLTQSDLLRNYLFMALGHRSNMVYKQYWRPMEKALGVEGLESLVRDELQSAGHFVRQADVYRTVRSEIEPFATDLEFLEGYIKKLARKGEFYSLFLQPSDPNKTASSLKVGVPALRNLTFLRAWGASTTYPFLLKLYTEVDANRATREQADSCLEAVESFIVRRHLADVPTNVLNRLFISIAGSVSSNEQIDVLLRTHLSGNSRWPNDDRVREGVKSVPYYANGRPHQQRLVLERLESHLRSEVDLDFSSAQLSIEHVMPQTLSDGWVNDLVASGHDPRETFERLGHTLGNLTLTAWNSKLSNKLFDRKQEILQDSDLKLNDSLAAASRWGVSEIEQRSEMLAAAAIELWSSPLSGIESAKSGFDWSRVDDAVAALPAGSWTSYGDLAELAGTAAQPTANHVAQDTGLRNAYRVLSSDGTISFDFRWHDPLDTRDPMELLVGEGVLFDGNDKASRSQRLGPPELETLIGGGSSDA